MCSVFYQYLQQHRWRCIVIWVRVSVCLCFYMYSCTPKKTRCWFFICFDFKSCYYFWCYCYFLCLHLFVSVPASCLEYTMYKVRESIFIEEASLERFFSRCFCVFTLFPSLSLCLRLLYFLTLVIMWSVVSKTSNEK